MTTHEETTLIKAAQKGDRAAFETLINAHYMTIYKMAYKWIQNREAAEDITQNACIKLARSLNQFQFNAAFTSWLYRLVINTAKDWQISNKRHAGADMSQAEYEESSSTHSEKMIYARQVLEKIDSLPAKEKDAFILVIFEGLNHVEAGQKLGCAEGTISWRINEARKKLSEWESKNG